MLVGVGYLNEKIVHVVAYITWYLKVYYGITITLSKHICIFILKYIECIDSEVSFAFANNNVQRFLFIVNLLNYKVAFKWIIKLLNESPEDADCKKICILTDLFYRIFKYFWNVGKCQITGMNCKK